MKQKRLPKSVHQILLDASGIDRISQLTVEALERVKADRKDVIRIRLAVEDILGIWLSKQEDPAQCRFESGSRLGRPYIHILLPGEKMDPAMENREEAGGLLYSSLLSQAGLSVVYQYRDQTNRLSLYPQKPFSINPLAQMMIAIFAAMALGLLCARMPESFQGTVAAVVDPLFTAMMGILQTLAAPMVFLGVCWGIVSIGDIGMLSRIGKTIISRFLVMIFLSSIFAGVCLVWLFHPGEGLAAETGNTASQIYGMILGIIPSNFLSPFVEDNSLQIIFIAICLGLALLVLGDKVPVVNDMICQANMATDFMMEILSRYIPLFTFVSLFSLMSSNALEGLGGVIKGILTGIVLCVALPLLYAAAVSIRMKTPFMLYMRKILPTYLIALTTASSSAALSTSLENCEKKLGISEHITRFAVPLGHVVFKFSTAAVFLVLAFGISEYYGMAMPFTWVLTGVLTSALLAIAAPPIPGGALTCYTVLLTQLGVPQEGIALAIAGNMVLDFFMTSANVSCLESELVFASHRLNMLDHDTLTREEKKRGKGKAV